MTSASIASRIATRTCAALAMALPLPTSLAAQEAPEQGTARRILCTSPQSEEPIVYAYAPAAADVAEPPSSPVVVLLGVGEEDTFAVLLRERLLASNWIVAHPAEERPDGAEESRSVAATVSAELRIGFRVARNRIHVVGIGRQGARLLHAYETAIPHEILSSVSVASPADREAALAEVASTTPASPENPPFLRHELDPTAAGARTLGQVAAILEGARTAFLPEDERDRAVIEALDAFHDAATSAHAERYFGAFAPEGVFLGTDATERWTVETFRVWAEPAFARRSAWMFTPFAQNVTRAPGKLGATIAWFDEELHSRAYGLCRGTGVLRRIDGTWRIAQYNLTVPVPNELLGEVVERIREASK
jgi:hypothetical protein